MKLTEKGRKARKGFFRFAALVIIGIVVWQFFIRGGPAAVSRKVAGLRSAVPTEKIPARTATFVAQKPLENPTAIPPTKVPIKKSPTEAPEVTVVPTEVEEVGPTLSVQQSTVDYKTIEISIIFAPEYKEYRDLAQGVTVTKSLLPAVIEEFNLAYDQGRNPNTGKPLAPGEKKIHVTGKDGSSGTVMQGIVNAILAPDNVNVERPTIYSPSVTHWLVIANYLTGRELFTLADAQPTGLAPVVIAIWESRLRALQKKYPDQPLGWQELLEVMNDPKGWASYGIILDRTAVYYAHTDPTVSSTGLSTLIAEFYASAGTVNAGQAVPSLTLEIVNDPRVQEGVHTIEKMVKHYWPRTTEMKWAIAEGPSFMCFTTIEGNDIPLINSLNPPERLIALYPKEGTFLHEHPFGIPNADWVSVDQREAAKVFTQYVLSEGVQKRILAAGFYPVNPKVKIGFPLVPELGVDASQPTAKLEVPAPEVIAAIQRSWGQVKKQADILILLDTSGSMKGTKIDQVKQASLGFVANQRNNNRVGLVRFSAKSDIPDIKVVCPVEGLESSRDQLIQAINSLDAEGGTPLYDALWQAIKELEKSESYRMRAIILLSDGKDEDADETRTLNDVIEAILVSKRSKSPVLVIPIAYGNDADMRTLGEIAKASETKVYTADPLNIIDILGVIGRFF